MSDKMTTAQYARKCREDFIREQGEKKLLAIEEQEEQRRLDRLDYEQECEENRTDYEQGMYDSGMKEGDFL